MTRRSILFTSILLIILTMMLSGCAFTSKKEYYGRTFFLPLKSSPSGAIIYLDEERKGYTPSTVQFTYLHDPRGKHNDESRQRTLKIEKDDYEPFIFTFSIMGKEYESLESPIILKLKEKVPEPVNPESNENNESFDEVDIRDGGKNVIHDPGGEEKKDVTFSNHNEMKKSKDSIRPINELSAVGWFERGLALGSKMKYKEEIEAYNRAIFLNAGYIAAYNNRAIAYRKLGQYVMALRDYGKVIELHPNDADAYFNRGITHIKMRRYESAIDDYNMTIALNPKLPDAYFNRATAHRKLGHYQSAIEDYSKAIELNPEDASAYFNRGIAYHKLEDTKSACSDWEQACSLGKCEYHRYKKEMGICH